MEILRKTMRKQTYILMIFGIAFHENSSFPKKVHVRKPHDSCSRIGVCEGPPKKKEIKKRGKSEEQSFEKHEKTYQKTDVKFIEKSFKNH